MTFRTLRISLLVSLSLVLAGAMAAPLVGAQGYTEINQSIIVGSGGFPYTISAPGYYLLTDNVVKTALDGNVAAIVISASNVTLDLGGYSIEGPGICSRNASTGAITCNGHVPGSGIQESGGNTNVEIRNGTVHGFFNGISTTATGTVLKQLTIYDNAFSGASAIGDVSRIENVTAIRNGSTGITVQNNSTVQACDASQNDDYGIIANLASAVVFSSTMGNRLGGMSLNPQAVFSANNVLDNFGTDPVFGGIDGGGNNCTNAIGTPVGC